MHIVFDLDGTLIDSAPDIQHMASTLLASYGRPGLTLAETRSFIGEGSAVFVRRMMSAREIEDTADAFASIHDAFLALYEHCVERAVFYPGVLNALNALKDAGHGLGLCTNKPQHAARAVLRHMRLEDYFDAVTAGGMLASRKPDPEMLHETIRRLGGGPALYVGDSETDAETARRAAVPFALYSQGYRKSPLGELGRDWDFDHFDALPDIVAQARKRIQEAHRC